MAYVLAGLVGVLGAWYYLVVTPIHGDRSAYWATRWPPLYRPDAEIGQFAYLYPPPFAQVIRPIVALPFEWFSLVLVIVAVIAYAWLVWPVRPPWRAPLLLLTGAVAVTGNPIWLVALGTVLGIKRAGWVSVATVVKLTPGVLILWHVTRGEWRAVALAVGVGLAIVGVSYVAWPEAWHDWVQFMLVADKGGQVFLWPLPNVPLVLRAGVAAALVVYAGRTARAWLLAPAMLIASPDIGLGTFAVLTALPRLLQAPIYDATSDRQVIFPAAPVRVRGGDAVAGDG